VGTWVVYSQENLTGNHNSILLTIYISCLWSMLWLLYAYPNVHALSLCPLVIYLMSTSRPACCIHVLWHYTLNPTLNFCCLYIHHVYTMRNCILWRHFYSKLFPILLDHFRPYDIMSCDFLVTCLLSLIID